MSNPFIDLLRSSGRRLEQWRPLWVGAALPTFVWAEGRFAGYGLAALALLWLWSGWASGFWLRRTPLNALWWIWLLMLPVTWWATALPEVTYTALCLFAAQSLAFWTLASWVRGPGRARWATAGLILLAAALGGLALFWIQWTTRFFSTPAIILSLQSRLPASLQEVVNKNVMAGILVGLWPLTLGWIGAASGRGRWLNRLVGGLAALGLLAVLFLTQSRGAWIAAAWAGFFLLALRWRIVWLGAPLAAAGLAILGWQGRLLPYLDEALRSDALGGIDGRLEIWSRALYAMQDFAFTGIGMGTHYRVIQLLYPYFLIGPDAEIYHAHNIFLQGGVDLGHPGLIAFLAMIVATAALIRSALKSLQEAGASNPAWLLRGAAAGLSALLVHGLVDAVTWNTRPAFLVWAVWGLAVGLSVTALESLTGQSAGE